MKLIGVLSVLGVVPIVRPTCAQVTGSGGRPAKTKPLTHERGLRGADGDVVFKPSQRGLQSTTTVDVMVLYSEKAWSEYDSTEDQLKDTIKNAFKSTDEAMEVSEIALKINLVHLQELPYDQDTTTTYWELVALREDSDVADLRDLHGADLVMMIGYFGHFAGRGYVFNGEDTNGFSVVDADSFDEFSHTHELAHNLGCLHNRENSETQTDYSHGMRYCDIDLEDRYRTIVTSDQGNCDDTPRINYFSNPDVIYNDMPTGDDENNNAQTIRDNMVAVSKFRDSSGGGSSGSVCPSAGDIAGVESPDEMRDEGHVCCLAGCGRCGGVGCSGLTGSAAECCISNITEHGKSCSDTDEAPCFISSGGGGGDDDDDDDGNDDSDSSDSSDSSNSSDD